MEAAAAIIDLRRTRERERKALSRANQTDEKRAAETIWARTGMARMRRKRAMPAGVGEEEGGEMGSGIGDDDASFKLLNIVHKQWIYRNKR